MINILIALMFLCFGIVLIYAALIINSVTKCLDEEMSFWRVWHLTGKMTALGAILVHEKSIKDQKLLIDAHIKIKRGIMIFTGFLLIVSVVSTEVL